MGQVFDFSPVLVNGLRRDAREPYGTLSASTYQGLKPTPYGAREHETALTFDITSPPASSWPYPQLFKGKAVTLMCTATAVYLVNTTVDPWTVAAITTYDINTPANTKSITGSGTWHFADFHSTWFLFNGTSQVFKTGWVDSSKTFVQNTITWNTGCDFRGRLVMGGFNSSNFWTSAWQTFWTSLAAKGLGDFGFNLSAPDTNWVGWSNIGGGDLLNIFLQTVAQNDVGSVTGGFSAAVPRVIESFRRLESGFMPMPFQGSILRVVPLRSHVVVYGTQGIAVISPHSNPVPTFGLVEMISHTGLKDRGLVCGGMDRHVFVDNEDVMWTISNELQLERLGYEEYMADLVTANNPLITRDHDQDEYYLSSGDENYLLTKTGLCRSPQRVSAIALNQDDKQAFYTVATESTGINITFNTTDFGDRNIKTVQEVQVTCRNAGTAKLQLGCNWRYRKSESFTALAAADLDEDGRLRLMLTAVEFQFFLTCSDDADVEHIEGVKVILSSGQKTEVSRRF